MKQIALLSSPQRGCSERFSSLPKVIHTVLCSPRGLGARPEHRRLCVILAFCLGARITKGLICRLFGNVFERWYTYSIGIVTEMKADINHLISNS